MAGPVAATAWSTLLQAAECSSNPIQSALMVPNFRGTGPVVGGTGPVSTLRLHVGLLVGSVHATTQLQKSLIIRWHLHFVAQETTRRLV